MSWLSSKLMRGSAGRADLPVIGESQIWFQAPSVQSKCWRTPNYSRWKCCITPSEQLLPSVVDYAIQWKVLWSICHLLPQRGRRGMTAKTSGKHTACQVKRTRKFVLLVLFIWPSYPCGKQFELQQRLSWYFKTMDVQQDMESALPLKFGHMQYCSKANPMQPKRHFLHRSLV